MADIPQDSDSLKAKLLRALAETNGMISDSCAMVGCSRRTYYNYMRDDPEFAQAWDDIQEGLIDAAERAIAKLVNKGPQTLDAAKFYLKTKGKKRGYVERNEVTGADGTPLQVNITVSNEEVKRSIENID